MDVEERRAETYRVGRAENKLLPTSPQVTCLQNPVDTQVAPRLVSRLWAQ